MLFSEFIKNYRNGVLDERLTLDLKKVVTACKQHSKMGQLKLIISLKPKSIGEMEVSIKHEKKIPERDTFDNIMFTDNKGDLFEDDPQQLKLFDKVECLVDNETGEVIPDTVKEINPEPQNIKEI